MKKKCSEITIQEICGIQAEIRDLLTKCCTPMATSDSISQNFKKVTDQLLAAAGKIIDTGQDLNAITSCLINAARNAGSDQPALGNASQILAWAGWTGDLAANVLDSAESLLDAFHELTRVKGGS